MATIVNLTQHPATPEQIAAGVEDLRGPALEAALRRYGVRPLYAFSRREAVEEVQPDGSVRKATAFRHAGFVEAV